MGRFIWKVRGCTGRVPSKVNLVRQISIFALLCPVFDGVIMCYLFLVEYALHMDCCVPLRNDICCCDFYISTVLSSEFALLARKQYRRLCVCECHCSHIY